MLLRWFRLLGNRASAQTDTGSGVSAVESKGQDKQATSMPEEANKVSKATIE